MEEITYDIEFADNGMVVRRKESLQVIEGNHQRMREGLGKIIYEEVDSYATDEATNKIKLTTIIEKG